MSLLDFVSSSQILSPPKSRWDCPKEAMLVWPLCLCSCYDNPLRWTPLIQSFSSSSPTQLRKKSGSGRKHIVWMIEDSRNCCLLFYLMIRLSAPDGTKISYKKEKGDKPLGY